VTGHVPELAELGVFVTEVSEAQLDEQPFGIIRLDRNGRVVGYNRYEEELAHLSRAGVICKSFFFEVAPCTRVREFYGRFTEGIEAGAMRVRFEFVFPFAHGARNVQITMFYREADDSVWVLVRE